MPTSNAWISFIALIALFLGGGAVGLVLARGLAPDSWAAQGLSLFALPLAFAVSLQTWYGLALLSLVPRLFGYRRPPLVLPPSPGVARPAIPGSFVFLPVTSGVGAVAGILVGFLSSTQTVWFVALVYWLVGTVHGLLAWRLARGGFLLPPESL